ncbi:sulfite exporter TauE/SafE family protein [Trinickia sp. NRRL B-1857]|uniref:sulfite exporter TauE/SafE family protein n=1 Tax=Trinickia sp. NRRL B-1857 TaxID=3162879 RepID=UPI003D2B3B43
MTDPHAISAALGSLVGLILALTGAGGGIVAVPLLVFGLKLDVATAGPIGLAAVGIAAALGALLALREGRVRYKAATLMAGAGAIVSPLGLSLARRVPNAPLMLLFALVLLYVAARMFLQQRSRGQASRPARTTPAPCHIDEVRGKLAWTMPCARALTFSGAIAGLLSGLLGVGGGFVIVPALRRISDIPIEGIVATSLAVIALVSTSGVVAASVSGHMAWTTALPFTAGAIAGMLGGRLIAKRLSGAHIQRGFAVFAGLIAIAMMVKASSII